MAFVPCDEINSFTHGDGDNNDDDDDDDGMVVVGLKRPFKSNELKTKFKKDHFSLPQNSFEWFWVGASLVDWHCFPIKFWKGCGCIKLQGF